jgi:hypothetical protein
LRDEEPQGNPRIERGTANMSQPTEQGATPEPTAQMEPGAADGQAHELTVIKIRCGEKPQKHSAGIEPFANGRAAGVGHEK